MQQTPLVSVICLCYNHEKFVIESLQSVKKQVYKNIELLIVDDCSTDNSVFIIKEWLINFPEIKFIVNKKNLGNTKSFNLAASFTKGDYLIDLAADDILLPSCVKMQVEKFIFSKFQNLAMVYGNAEIISENGLHKSYFFEVDENKKTLVKRDIGDIYTSVISSGNSYCSVTSMFKKSFFLALGGYNEFLLYEDLDFWIRVSRNYNIDFIDAVLVQKRLVKNSLETYFKKTKSEINENTYKILKQTIGRNRDKKEDLAILKRVHYEIIHSYKNRDLNLLLKNMGLKLWLFTRQYFYNYFKKEC